MATGNEILDFLTAHDTLVAIGVVLVLAYLTLNQRSRILEWLVLAVTNSEKDLGGGTGQLKLRTVYDWFITRFPILSIILPFALFSLWVNKALVKMRNLKDTNIKVASYITNKPVEELKAEAKAKAESGKTETKVKVETTSIPKEDSIHEDLSEKQP